MNYKYIILCMHYVYQVYYGFLFVKYMSYYYYNYTYSISLRNSTQVKKQEVQQLCS